MLAKLLKFLIALALIPLVAGEVWTLVDLVPAAGVGWRESWALSLAAGFVTWLLVFFLLSRTMWLYVLGHEFTHALAAMLAGGKVSAFKVSSKGGHVMTDRVSWWIALWLTVDFYHPLKAWQPILYFGIGLFWSFHITFTISMCHLRQTDLANEGFLFSGVVLLLFNLIGILLLLGILTHEPGTAWKLFLTRTAHSYSYVGHEITVDAIWAWNQCFHRSR